MKKTMKQVLSFILTLCILCSFIPAVYAETADSALTTEEFEVLKIANQEREKEGLSPLTSLPELQKATDTRAMELVELFSHTRPNGNSCYSVLDEVTLPGYSTAGENIAAGYVDAQDAMTGWMNSSGHKRNILNTAFIHVGVGHYYQADSTYRNHWVQFFFSSFGCQYTDMTVSLLEDKAVRLGTPIEELDMIACLNCNSCGKSYLPVQGSYCSGYDPNKAGVQTVTVSCLGQTATIDITVEAPTVDTELKIYHTLELASDIAVKYVVEEARLADYDSFRLDCVLPVYEGNVQTGTKTLTLEPQLKEGYYYFTLDELTAVHMADVAETTMYMQKGDTYYVSATDRYSIATYAYKQLAKDSASETLKKLCADLLVYGAAAQTFKGYRTDNLADLSMTAEERAYATDLETVTFGNTNTVMDDLENPSLTWAGKTLNLESRVTLKFVYDATNYTGDPQNVFLRVSYRNQDGVYCTNFVYGGKAYGEGNLYYFEYSGLLASELRNELSVCVIDGSNMLTPTLRYTADTYGNGKTGNLRTLCQALFAYSDAAKAFFAG